jgi:hypothetical protein
LKVTSLIADPSILSSPSLVPAKEASTAGWLDLAGLAIIIGTGRCFRAEAHLVPKWRSRCRRQRNSTIFRAALTPEQI